MINRLKRDLKLIKINKESMDLKNNNFNGFKGIYGKLKILTDSFYIIDEQNKR